MRGVRQDPERAEVRVLLRHGPVRGAHLLDIGCGSGRLTRRLARFVRSAVGIDPDGDGVAQARRPAPARWAGKLRYVAGAAEALPFPDGRFDVALFSWSL